MVHRANLVPDFLYIYQRNSLEDSLKMTFSIPTKYQKQGKFLAVLIVCTLAVRTLADSDISTQKVMKDDVTKLTAAEINNEIETQLMTLRAVLGNISKKIRQLELEKEVLSSKKRNLYNMCIFSVITCYR
ncbi:uncharacterized protein LOC131949335 [Physella acuta]|uniref:uncharacterized protein LOC131949335 n=1 Tax=Physella acuta TaxID=109671 RepID=UPI0027DCDCC4|nr:uncharacterized protein LOC131949335 [Physella acuta]